jgi:hypothetical protein
VTLLAIHCAYLRNVQHFKNRVLLIITELESDLPTIGDIGSHLVKSLVPSTVTERKQRMFVHCNIEVHL